MTYLDVRPMMTALRETPEEFEMKGNWLVHNPSRHSFTFSQAGRVQIMADCNCALMEVQPEQERGLSRHFQEWQAVYWQPLQINKEFASHFRPRSPLRQMMIDLTAALHRRLIRQPGVAAHHHHDDKVLVPAE